MDWGRRCYTTTARFFRDSPIETKVRWFPADTNKPPLPFPSKICSIDWMGEKHEKEGVGEVWNTPRTFKNDRKKRNVEGNHICGTEDEFRNGEILDPSRQLTKYGPSGIPLCCEPGRREADGRVSIMGNSHYAPGSVYPSSGRVAINGVSTSTSEQFHGTPGSIALRITTRTIRSEPYHGGGRVAINGATVVERELRLSSDGRVAVKSLSRYTASTVCPEWAETCFLAPLGWVDHECAKPIGPFGDAEPFYPTGWRVWELEKNTDYRWSWRFENGLGAGGGWKLTIGTACSARVFLGEGFFAGLGGAHVTFNSGDSDRLFALLEDVEPALDGDVFILATVTL